MWPMPEARSLLCRSVELLSSLRAIQHQLITVPSDNATLWNSTMEQANRYKEELVSIRRKFDSGDVIEHLSRKMNKTRAKRARDRRCRGQRRGFLSAREARAEAATEKWLDDRRQEELKAKTEKSVQKAATGVLGDVKRKISDLHRYISLVKALKELRDIRREASRKKGDAPPIEADELFSATHQSAVELLSQQSVVYEQEEHALRVLMEEELNEKMAREKARRAARPPVEPHPPPVPLLPLPLPPPMEPHPLPRPPPPVPMATPLMAIGVETHTSIRSEWNHYLSSEGTALPSDEYKAPPTQPSSTQWAEYLQQSKTIPHQ